MLESSDSLGGNMKTQILNIASVQREGHFLGKIVHLFQIMVQWKTVENLLMALKVVLSDRYGFCK